MAESNPVASPAVNPWHSTNSLESADVIVPLVLRYVPARGVVDFGCKHGEWLSVFRRFGVATILGFDQEKRAGRLAIDRAAFRVADLNRPLVVPERFDLAVCIEVAEHLLPSSAEPLVKTITTSAPVVLFSAAAPGQGGHGHHNEQPHGYWHALFAKYGFQPIDCLRPQIWHDRRVAFWYRQNLFFYASAAGLAAHPELAAEAARDRADDLELVHVTLLNRPTTWQRAKNVMRRLRQKYIG